MIPELFSAADYRRPLTDFERETLIDSIYRRAKLGAKYMYSVRETSGMFHISFDEMQTLLTFYRIDCIKIREVVRIPWWSLCEYLIDPADDVDEAVEKYLSALPHKITKSHTITGNKSRFCILEPLKIA